jgi:aerobic carbon-monoxide dehydrogenase large subunit
MGMRFFGARVKRLEDPTLLKGRGRFVDDLHLPGMLHAAFVRSPHAHARIRSVSAERARGVRGVRAVMTLADLPPAVGQRRLPLLVPNPAIRQPWTQFALAKDEACYVGEAVAVVVAQSRYAAEDGAAQVGVDYEVLPASADCRTAIDPGAALAHLGSNDNVAARFPVGYGDVRAAFAGAAHVFTESLWHHRGCGQALECRGVLANYDELADLLTVWSATQSPHGTKRSLVEALGRDENQIRVIAPDVGGGFGPKGIFYPEETVVPACAMLLGRPVKWTEDRLEHFTCATQERDQYWDVEIAVGSDGRILGVRGAMIHDTGAYLPWGMIMPYIAATTMPGPYVVPSFRMDVTVALTNKTPTTPVRGAGRPQAVFAMERLLDRVARELRLDPADVRRRNLVPPDRMPYAVGLMSRDGSPVTYDSGDYPACQAKALESAAYADFPARQTRARAEGRLIGIGIANYVEGTGLGPFEGAIVRVMPSGKVFLVTGAAPQGQGHRTTLAQICADHLGVRPEDVTVVMADTAAIPMGIGTFASRIAVNAGSSVHVAAAAVREKILTLAAHMLEAAAADLELEGGRAVVRGAPDRAVTFGQMALLAVGGMPGYSMPGGLAPGLEATSYFTPSQSTYCNGTHVAEVEVDTETGDVRILRYTVAHDSGRLINPLVVDGQIEGGVAHGIGNALYEWMRYDDQAQPLTTTFVDYLLPLATDMPPLAMTHLETPTPLNPLGVKGAGEGGTIPAAAAIIAAVENALQPFGLQLRETPITPERITELIDAAGAVRGNAAGAEDRPVP